jgi:hypothetical protein
LKAYGDVTSEPPLALFVVDGYRGSVERSRLGLSARLKVNCEAGGVIDG